MIWTKSKALQKSVLNPDSAKTMFKALSFLLLVNLAFCRILRVYCKISGNIHHTKWQYMYQQTDFL